MTTPGKNTWLYIVAGLIITANVVTLAMMWMHHKENKESSDNRPEHRPGGPGGPFNYLTAELKFDQKQKDAYSLLRDEHHRKAEQLQDSIRHAKDELFNMLHETNATEEQIMVQANKAAAFSIQLDTLTFHHFQKVRMLCNPEQKEKFDAVINEALRSMGGPHPGPPPGERP